MKKNLLRPLLLLAVALFLSICLISGKKASAATAPIAYVNFDGYPVTHASNGVDDQLYSAFNNMNFTIEKQGDPNYLHDWISPSVKYGSSGNSLGVELSPPTTDPLYQKQRIEFRLADNDYGAKFAQTFGTLRYYGFVMKIGPTSDDSLKRGVIFTQVWQSNKAYVEGYSKHPPFDLRFIDDSAYAWNIQTSNDCASDVEGCQVSYTPSTYKTLAKDTWYSFVIGFKPSYNTNNGFASVWVKKSTETTYTNVFSQSNQRNFGYRPVDNQNVKIVDAFTTRFGAYGKPEAANPKHVVLFFDQARWGTTQDSVE